MLTVTLKNSTFLYCIFTAMIVASAPASPEVKGDPREAIAKATRVIVDNLPSLVDKQPDDVNNLVAELSTKTHKELSIIKYIDTDHVCS